MVLSGGETGPEVAEQALALVPGLKVLYMSGYTENTVLHQGRLDDGIDLVAKPFDKDDLAAKLRAVLDADGK